MSKNRGVIRFISTGLHSLTKIARGVLDRSDNENSKIRITKGTRLD